MKAVGTLRGNFCEEIHFKTRPSGGFLLTNTWAANARIYACEIPKHKCKWKWKNRKRQRKELKKCSFTWACIGICYPLWIGNANTNTRRKTQVPLALCHHKMATFRKKNLCSVRIFPALYDKSVSEFLRKIKKEPFLERCSQRSGPKGQYILRKNVNINSKYIDAVIN